MTGREPATPTAAGVDGDPEPWAQPRYQGRALVITMLVAAATTTVLLVLPIPDPSRRPVVLALLVILFGLQALVALRAWRAGRRPLSPRWLRVVNQAG